MTWYDAIDVLFDGTRQEVEMLRCPDCGGAIRYIYSEAPRSLRVQCLNCGYISISHGCEKKPNCADYVT